jgi:hypothetical protein
MAFRLLRNEQRTAHDAPDAGSDEWTGECLFLRTLPSVPLLSRLGLRV